MAFQSTKLAFFLCSQCTYLTQETGALQESCDCVPCSHLNIRFCRGIWAAALGKGEPMQSLPLFKALGVPGAHCALHSCCGPGHVSRALLWLLDSSFSSLGCRVRAVPPLFSPCCHCSAGVLQLHGKAACKDGAGCCFPEPSMGSSCCPFVGQVHQNI